MMNSIRALSILMILLLTCIAFGGSACAASVSTSSNDPSYSLGLGQGWNLVSIPVVNSSLKASSLDVPGIQQVCEFNSTSLGFNPYVEGWSKPSADFALNCGVGYYVYCTANTSLLVYGSNPSNASVVISPRLNMIGWASYNSSTALAVCDALSGSSSTIISRFNSSTGGFDSYVQGWSKNASNFVITPGVGYFLYSYSATPQTIYYNSIPQTQLPPAASFSANVTSGTAPLTVQLNDMSTGYPTSWNWSFGDGGMSTLQNPVHTYNTQGNYSVSLTAANAAGCNTMYKTGYITVVQPAYGANFTANVTSGIAWNVATCEDSPNFGATPLVVQFNDTSVGATSWQWNFDDNTTNSTVQNPVHSFANAWSYNVTLTVTTPGGNFTVKKYNYINVLLPVTGNVANPLNLSLADLMNSSLYPQITISNHTYGAHHDFYQIWATGASLSAILNSSNVNSGATGVTFYGSDGDNSYVALSRGPGNIMSDNESMIAYDWYSNDNSSQGGDNQTERNIIPSQTYGEYWVYDLVAVQVS